MYYHGAVPIDFYYICSHILLYKGRLINPVGDRFLFKIPGALAKKVQFLKNDFYRDHYDHLGWSSLLEAFGVIPGTVQSCAALLRKGNLLAIAPGGVYEAQLGDNNYELLWRKRLGYAKVAIEAKVVNKRSTIAIWKVLNVLLPSSSPSFQCLQETFEKLFVHSTFFNLSGIGCTKKLICHSFLYTEVFL